ncbi:MAG: ABC transporter substrate-binding protein [Hyphomicrobiales bacterium]
MDRRSFVAGVVLAGAWRTSGFAQAAKPVKIGILNDMSSVYADYQGIGSVIGAQMAVEDEPRGGIRVEIVSADHQNKPDIGLSIARRWFDTEGVDVVMDVPNSAVALAVAQLCRDKNKVLIGSGAGSSELTGKACSPNTVHWTYDTWQLGNSYGRALMEAGAKRWFFITADYAFGKDLEASCANSVKASGGEILGSARHPIATTDFSSYLVQAKSSGADVVAFCNAGDDLNNSLKQAAEFGLAPKQKLVGLVFNITNVPGLGLKACQGLEAISSFYWDLNEDTRYFSNIFRARHPRHNMPNDMQAGVYAATMHYLKAVKQLGSAADGKAVVDTMKAIPTDDPLFGRGSIRVDGRKLHAMYLFDVKTLAESTGPWDVFKRIKTFSPEESFRPLSQGGCPLVN